MLFPSANFFEPDFFICFCRPCIIRHDIQIYFVKSEDFKSILEEELNTFCSIALRPIVFVEDCDSQFSIPVFSVDFKRNVPDILFALNTDSENSHIRIFDYVVIIVLFSFFVKQASADA